MTELSVTADAQRGIDPGRKWIKACFQSAAILLIGLVLGLLVNYLRSEGLPLVADWSMESRLSKLSTVENPIISLDEAAALYATQGAIFIDARTEEFYRDGHIEGARNLPWEEFEDRYQDVMWDISPDALIVVYCDGDVCSLSKDLAEALAGKGYFHVRVLLNGWSLWQAAKLPAATG